MLVVFSFLFCPEIPRNTITKTFLRNIANYDYYTGNSNPLLREFGCRRERKKKSDMKFFSVMKKMEDESVTRRILH